MKSAEEIRSAWRPPPGAFAVGYLCWGFFTGQWLAAILMAIILEAPHVLKNRLEFEERDFVLFWNFSMLLTLGFLTVNLMRVGADQTFRLALTWAPVLVSPLVIVQRFAGGDPIPLNTVFVLIRRKRRLDRIAGREVSKPVLMDFGYPLLGVVLLSCGVGRHPGFALFWVGLISVAVLLLRNVDRPRLGRWGWWKIVLAMLVMGLSSWMALEAMFTANKMLQHLYRSGPQFGKAPDDRWSHTRIGQLGHIKLSSRVDWLMKAEKGPAPWYLREATFSTYVSGMWLNDDTTVFFPVNGEENDWAFGFRGDVKDARIHQIQLRGRPPTEEQVIPMPYGPVRAWGTLAAALNTNDFGAVQAAGLPEVADYHVAYHAGRIMDSPPVAADESLDHLRLYELVRLREIGEKLIWGTATTDVECVAALERFFANGFSYTTFTENEESQLFRKYPILSFLTERRRGHCEYYATATVLLLRGIGIPARYSVGYGVSEWDSSRGMYVLRGRDRHAWAQVWLEGEWRIVDTTPGGWNEADQSRLGVLAGFNDWFQNQLISFQLWQASDRGNQILTWLGWTLIPAVLLYLMIRMLTGKRRVQKEEEIVEDVPLLGMDSEYFAVERAMVGAPQPAIETIKPWVADCRTLHDRYRFDPLGLTQEERDTLRKLADRCLNVLSVESLEEE